MLIRTNGNEQKPHAILLYPKTGMDLGSTVAPPHALLTVAAPMLKAGYNIKLLDQRVESITEPILRDLITSDCLAVGISTMSGTQVAFALGLAKLVRNVTDGKVPIVWGGCHPTVTPEQTLSHPLVDIVAIGEGDYTMLDIVEALGAKRSLVNVPGILYKDGPTPVKTLPRPMLNVEELLPTPWELVDPEKYIHRDMYLRNRHRCLDIGQTSRGCPFDCAFCHAPDTLVLTDEGALPISQIVEQKRARTVWTSRGTKEIIRRFRHEYAGEMVRIQAKGHLAVVSTPNHEYLTRRGWMRADALQTGDELVLPVENQVRDIQSINVAAELSDITIQSRRRLRSGFVESAGLIRWPLGRRWANKYLPLTVEFMRLVGLYLAEGAVTHQQGRYNSGVLVWYFGKHEVALHEELVGLIQRVFAQTPTIVNDRTSTQIKFGHAIYARLFERLFGIGSADKHFPLSWLSLPNDLLVALVQGYLDGDGYRFVDGKSTHRERWSAHSISPSLAIQMQLVAARLGISSGVWRAKQPSNKPIEGRFVKRKDLYQWWFTGKVAIQGPPVHWSKVRHISKIAHQGTVYNLEVADYQAYSANGLEVHNCSSASIRERKWRAQSVDRVLDDLQSAIRRFRLDAWWWRDDEFYIKRKRANAIFEAIVREGIDGCWYTSGTRCDVFGKATEEEVALMKRAGAYTLKFGAESGSQRVLDVMQKGITVEQTLEANQKCRRHGITPAFSLMIGYPTETFEEMNQTIDLGYRLKRENPRAELETMCQYTALPGTPDWHLALKHGLVPPKSLEEWAGWCFDEYDLEGVKSPWYSRKERRYLGNISYSSILANSFDNAVSSIRTPWMRIPAQAVMKPAAKYFKWRLSTHRYRWMPELEIVRFLRERLFYRSVKTIS